MKHVSRKVVALALVGRGRRARLAVAVRPRRAAARRRPAFRSASCSRTRSRPSAGCSSTRPTFAKALKAAGVTYSITNALNDPQKQKAQAQACLAAGAKVVIETSLDNGSASAIEKLFTSKGGKAIDYDRQVIGGTASVYVSFDGKAVGQAQANGIIAAMKAKGNYGKKPVVAELWGGQTDQNAFWFKSGNDAVLNPLFKSGKLTKGPQQFVPDWLATNAAPIFSQMLVKTNNKIDAAIAANDNIAGAVIATLKAKHLQPIPLSGQDASRAGRAVHPRRLADRERSTSTCPTRRTPPLRLPWRFSRARSRSRTRSRPNGKKKEPTQTIPVVWITKANYKRLFTDGFLKKSQVCIGAYKQYCK